MSQLFASGGQSIRASASASVLPMNIQDWFSLGWTGLIFLQYNGLSRVFSNTAVQKHQSSKEVLEKLELLLFLIPHNCLEKWKVVRGLTEHDGELAQVSPLVGICRGASWWLADDAVKSPRKSAWMWRWLACHAGALLLKVLHQAYHQASYPSYPLWLSVTASKREEEEGCGQWSATLPHWPRPLGSSPLGSPILTTVATTAQFQRAPLTSYPVWFCPVSVYEFVLPPQLDSSWQARTDL